MSTILGHYAVEPTAKSSTHGHSEQQMAKREESFVLFFKITCELKFGRRNLHQILHCSWKRIKPNFVNCQNILMYINTYTKHNSAFANANLL